jgi:hypothetical protein
MNDDISAVATMLRAMGKFDNDQIDAAVAALEHKPAVRELATDHAPLLTSRDLCERLRISSTTLWRVQPPFVRIGGRKRYNWLDVQAFLAARSSASEPDRRAAK